MTHEHNPSGQPTVSPLRYTSAAFIVVIAVILTVLLAACASTSVDAPDLTPVENEDLILTISSGDHYTFPTTRADDPNHTGHQLRFTAWLYEEYNNGVVISKDPTNLVRRVEQLATGDDNTVIFKNVPADKYYFVIVFADYIDADSRQDESGHYPDRYYDTLSDAEIIKLTATHDEIFNNHNLDCFLFVSAKTFRKEANKAVDITCNLTRMVSRIQVQANSSGSSAALKDISVNKYSVISDLEIIGKSGRNLYNQSPSLTITPADPASGLLIFYYTLNAYSGIPLQNTEFTLNPEEGYQFANDGKYKIPGDNHQIVPEANYIYTVKGDFLNITDQPAKTFDLSVSVDKEWETPSKDIVIP